MLKSEIRNPKSEIGRLLASGAIVFAACLAAAAVLSAESARPRGPLFDETLKLTRNIYGNTDATPWFPYLSPDSKWQDKKLFEQWVKDANKFSLWFDTERQAGGLVMKIREDTMPEVNPPGGVWFTMFRPIHGQGHPSFASASPVCFGSIRPVPMLPGEHFFAGQQPAWGANKLTFTYIRPKADGDEEEAEFSLTVNRLSPAMLAESDSDRVIFFSGIPNTPCHLAWAAKGKVNVYSFHEGDTLEAKTRPWQDAVKKGFAEDLLADDFPYVELGGAEWALVWFGKESSYFNASGDARFLYWYKGHSHGETHKAALNTWMKKDESYFAKADMPFLLVFENPASGATLAEGGGIRFDFDEKADKVVLHPLFGEDLPAADEISGWHGGLTESTLAWAGQLPQKIVEKCEWWAERLRAFPIDVEESAKYDSASDELTLAYRFKYEPVGEGGVKFAPIPPILALASDMGFPAALPEHAATEYFTQVGPYRGVDNAEGYELRMRGLGKYVKQARTTGSKTCPEAEKLEARLQRELEKILAAGRLAPGFYAFSDISTYTFRRQHPFLWDRPGEMLTCLGQARDFLPEALRTQVAAYMKDEQTARPAERIVAVPARDGVRREPFSLDTRMPKLDPLLTERADFIPDILDFSAYLAQHNDRYLKEGLVPLDALYALAEYKRCIPDSEIDWPAAKSAMAAHDSRRDWATLGFFKCAPSQCYFRQGEGASNRDIRGGGRDNSSVEISNAYLAGCIGLARLAGLFDDRAFIDEAYARFYLAAAHRYAVETYVQWFYNKQLWRFPPDMKPDWLAQLYSGSWTGWRQFIAAYEPGLDSRQIRIMDEMGVDISYGSGMDATAGAAVPEVGRFLNDSMGDALRARARAEFEPADWFVWCGGGYGIKKPLDNARFLLHAWVLGASAEELAWWVGAPWATVGDLNFIQRLTEALFACRGIEWREWNSPKPQ